MTYRVGDFVPSGPFLWKGKVNGDLCGCTVTWTHHFTPAIGVDSSALPQIIEANEYVAVTPAIGADGKALPVSPGILVLTPTAAWDGGSVILPSLQLRLMVNGTVTGCPPLQQFGCNAELIWESSVGEECQGIACSADGAVLAVGQETERYAICFNALDENPSFDEFPTNRYDEFLPGAFYYRNPSISDSGGLILFPGAGGPNRAIIHGGGGCDARRCYGPIYGISTKISSTASAMPSDGSFLLLNGTGGTPYYGIYSSTPPFDAFELLFKLNEEPRQIACSGSGELILATTYNASAGTLHILDNNTVSTKTFVPYVQAVGVSRDGQVWAVAEYTGNRVHVYRSGVWSSVELVRSNGIPVSLLAATAKIAMSSDGRRIFVASIGNGLFFSQDYGATFDQCPFSDLKNLRGVCCSADGSIVFVAEYDNSAVWRVT